MRILNFLWIQLLNPLLYQVLTPIDCIFLKNVAAFLSFAKQREAELYRVYLFGQALSVIIFLFFAQKFQTSKKAFQIQALCLSRVICYILLYFYLIPCLRLASIKSLKSPSSTLCVLPISTLVRKSLIRD